MSRKISIDAYELMIAMASLSYSIKSKSFVDEFLKAENVTVLNDDEIIDGRNCDNCKHSGDPRLFPCSECFDDILTHWQPYKKAPKKSLISLAKQPKTLSAN